MIFTRVWFMPSPPTSTAELLALVKKSGLLTPDAFAAISQEKLPDDPQKAAALLVAQNTLTKFQAVQLLAGRHKGFRIGAYTILDLLGRGGMGAVYLAEHVALHRKVAVKVLVPAKEDDQKLAMVRFQREARAAAALDHPNIVRIFDVANHQGVPYLVMEYVEGETLQAVIDRDGPIPYTTATEYIAQAAAGLQHAHEKGFVHRDIKPGNLIRDNAGSIKILDMGLARSVNPNDQLTAKLDQGAVVGTADFIAPEQAINNPAVDIRADIYSLGASLFALIIGKPPFEGNTTQKLLQHQLRTAPTLDSVDATLPRGLGAVVDKMLAKKPEERYQTPAEVIGALSPWLASSARILVGLSCTRMAEDEALQSSLSGIQRVGSSHNLPSLATLPDSGEFQPLQAFQETGTIAAAKTTRESNRPAASPDSKRKRISTLAIAGLAILAIGGLGGWLLSGGEKKPAPDDPAGNEKAQVEPRRTAADSPRTGSGATPIAPTTTPIQVGTSPAPEPGEKVIFQFDAAGQQPFVVRSTITVDPSNDGKKTHKVLSTSGPGEPPPGWVGRCWNKESEMDFFAELFAGKTTIGIRNLRAPASAMLFTPPFECPSGACRLKLNYQAATRDKRIAIKFKPSDQRGAWEVAFPQATGDVWRDEDLIVDLKGAAGGYFEFHDNDSSPNAAFRLRSVTISELKPVGPGSDKVLFELAAADVPEFRATLQGNSKTSGNLPPKIKGLSIGAYKKETVNEWSCGPVQGEKVLACTNVNEVRSTQMVVELENESGLGLKFRENQRLRVRIVYRTEGRGRGQVIFQTYGDWKSVAYAPLRNSNHEWSTVELDAIRGDKPIRCVVDCSETGVGNTLCIRSITVTQVGKPAAVTAQPEAPPEGKTVFSLDVGSIPEFRVVKEQFTRIDGEPENLPPGVGCHAWKANSVGEFQCGRVENSQALMVTNRNSEISAQYFFQLEGELKVVLKPGKQYRVKVGYLSQNDANGGVIIQTTPGYKALASAPLANSDGKWAQGGLTFTRPAEEEHVEVRLVIDNNTVGEGNALCIRSIEIVELNSVE
jgi:serine/threonine protein kinase